MVNVITQVMAGGLECNAHTGYKRVFQSPPYRNTREKTKGSAVKDQESLSRHIKRTKDEKPLTTFGRQGRHLHSVSLGMVCCPQTAEYCVLSLPDAALALNNPGG